MRKKIAILGSTGSIGKSTLDIIEKDKKNFEVHKIFQFDESSIKDHRYKLEQVIEEIKKS